MSDYQHPGARNPKVARFTIALAAELNQRLEDLSDKAGQNKTTMAATALAAGISVLEPIFQLRLEKLIEDAANSKAAELREDLRNMPEQK